MRVLKIIHGYPPLYNAGSEIYSQTLCAELSARHEVHVFTREENPFVLDGTVRHIRDPLCKDIRLHLVNCARVGTNYNSQVINQAFATTLRDVNPDIAHIGHLSHLSLGIVDELAQLDVPIVYTLHDFWLMCLRGQFIQVMPSPERETWPLCSGPENRKCAQLCLSRFTGDDAIASDLQHRWMDGRTETIRRLADQVNIFVAPSNSLASQFKKHFPLVANKIEYLDYGFDLRRLSGRQRKTKKSFVFGYIGTHIPGKGVHHLLQAFEHLSLEHPNIKLRIWGRETSNTTYLKSAVSEMPARTQSQVCWMGEYANQHIVKEVFNQVDAIIVPSIWLENSPLVIHEAQQARVPVIAANMGGMAEYVRHEENGLLYQPRNPSALAEQMERLAANPEWAETLGQRGYLYDQQGDIPSIGEHAAAIENLYLRALSDRNRLKIEALATPWRITFDTNPDHCNYHCTMCEEHSEYSPLQFDRRKAGVAKRKMPFELIERTVRELAPKGLREIIPSTMGEPLLYKQFEDIVALCKETDVMLNVTTNGSFPRLGARGWAELLVPLTSDIKISWNGASKQTQEAVMKNSNFEDMLANVRAFIAVRDAHAKAGGNRCQVTLQMTFMESNYRELPDIVRLAASLGVDRIKGHHLWVHFSEMQTEDMRRDTDAIRRWNHIVELTRRAASQHLLPDGRQITLQNIEMLNASAELEESGTCPFLGKEAWISTEGRFNPCCAPDAERRSLGEFGNLREISLQEIWNGQGYQNLLRTYRSRSVCRKCNMRNLS